MAEVSISDDPRTLFVRGDSSTFGDQISISIQVDKDTDYLIDVQARLAQGR